MKRGIGSRAIDLVNRGLLFAGWRFGPLLGDRTRRVIAGVGSRLATVRPSRGLKQWQASVTVATGKAPDRALVRAAARSYLRNYLESLALPAWNAERLVAKVGADEARLAEIRAAVAGRGAVLALPHMGNWDLAGAWACAIGLPVSTVAEQLAAPEFAAFLRYREGLGMRVYSHRDATVLESLSSDLAHGCMVCLVADRNLGAGGVEVRWPTANGSVAVRIPVGPAALAQRTGALLLPTATTFTADGIQMWFGEPVEHRPGPEGLQSMCQDVADFFASMVAVAPEDWHVFQPFFPGVRP